ncbi:Cobalt-precorrin-5B C(1)-methyltransferase [Streptomyces californicus]
MNAEARGADGSGAGTAGGGTGAAGGEARGGRSAQLKHTGLRPGWTTGACATAATTAAYTALLTGDFPDPVSITLPKGQTPAFALAVEELTPQGASAGVVKDAGDDPDVTHGALVRSTVRRLPPGSGVVFRAGPGVGTVTLPGLPLEVGEPAVNPVPRRLMREHVERVAAEHGAAGDVEITVSVDHGEEIARSTWNGRLGILGGLSILGTTGVVVPYSCSAWIDSIRRGARAHQRWRLIASGQDDGEVLYRIENLRSGKVLEVVGGGTVDGAVVAQRAYGGSDADHQLWRLIPVWVRGPTLRRCTRSRTATAVCFFASTPTPLR